MTKRKRLPLKTVYYLSFLFLIVIPILVVLLIALLFLNQQFKKQAIENINRAQETVIAELRSDIDTMSMRLSHLIYTNNNEILGYAAGTDVSDWNTRYEFTQKLAQAGNLALEPVKDIVSVGFYMSDGKETYIKNEINRTDKEVKETAWYQEALKTPNRVFVGSYDTVALNDLFTGGKKDMFILVFALAPDVMTDRSQKIEMVTFYQATGAAERIKEYNNNYLSDRNKLGITQIKDSQGNVIFSTEEELEKDFSSSGYTKVSSPLELENTVWYIESYIETSKLTAEYWSNAVFVLGAAVLILLLAGYFSRYFLRSIVKPVEEMNGGLRQVEEGNLEVHITPQGQFELRSMIHQFNAMVRRLKALIEEYEERVRSVEKTPGDCFAAMMKEEITPEELDRSYKEFFAEHYTILCFYVDTYGLKELKDSTKNSFEKDYVAGLLHSFERNPRFVSRCISYKESQTLFFALYRITEEDYLPKVIKMAEELKKSAKQEFGVSLCICIGQERFGYTCFAPLLEEVRKKLSLRYLVGQDAVIDLNKESEVAEHILELSKDYEKLAVSLYTADEKNMVQEREKLFELFGFQQIKEIRIHVCAVILALGGRFGTDNGSFSEVFGQEYNYIDKINRIEDIRSMKLWLTNYFAWIMDYSASRLNVSETDVIVKAKRYITDHYEDADLALNDVAEYVGLNEKYFTNRFTKETGETFSSYTTGLRMQKAKELLKTTSFKIYEIAEMSGYHNVEHFNRMFKKLNGVSPAQYRKTM